jgi:hypothetical protein
MAAFDGSETCPTRYAERFSLHISQSGCIHGKMVCTQEDGRKVRLTACAMHRVERKLDGRAEALTPREVCTAWL